MTDQTTGQTASSNVIVEISQAVAQSLAALDRALDGQRIAIAQISEDLAQATVKLFIEIKTFERAVDANDLEACKTAAEGLVAKADLTSQTETMSPANASNMADDTLGAGAQAALIEAYQNAVTSQQQLAVLAQAALTEGIAQLYSVVGDALGSDNVGQLKDHLASKKAESGA